jgi:hypothetical protein
MKNKTRDLSQVEDGAQFWILQKKKKKIQGMNKVTHPSLSDTSSSIEGALFTLACLPPLTVRAIEPFLFSPFEEYRKEGRGLVRGRE